MKKVVLINSWVDRPWEQFVNQTIAAEAKLHSNITVVNWFALGGRHPQDFYPDGIHLIPTGAQHYAGLIAAAVAIPVKVAPTTLPTPTKLLSCAGTTVVRPSSFVISCADRYIELTKAHWSTWSKDAASGTSDFGLNACVPTCVASTMSYYPDSKVRISTPITTKYGDVFSSLVVHYKLGGKEKTFSFEWRSDATA
jgi:hypothetical protein